MLLEHETQKMRELEEQYQAELKEWKGQLRPRKQVRHRRLIVVVVVVTTVVSGVWS